MQQIKTFVTTGGRPNEESIQLAHLASKQLNIPFIERKKKSVHRLIEELQGNILVAGKNRYEYYTQGSSSPFFFHPNSAAFRLKRLLNGEDDPMVKACGLGQGDSFLDCTLGMASDSIIASYVVGDEGKVVGIEVDPYIAFVVEKGLHSFETDSDTLKVCMERIQVVNANALDFLEQQEDEQFDVVYLDPMFDEIIEEANNFEALRTAGSHFALTEKWVNEAKRVAKRKVVLKAHFRSSLFDEFGFERGIRLTSKFHYGVLEK